MADLRQESIAICEATFFDVSGHHAAIILSMWHHLLARPERDALFAGFEVGQGHSSTLLQALLTAIRARSRGAWPLLRAPPGLEQSSVTALDRAFGQALKDVLGRAAAPMVVNAWCEVFRAFMAELHGRTP